MKNLSLLKKFAILAGSLSLIIFAELALIDLGVDKVQELGNGLNNREIPILNKAYQVKLSVVQVQQWITDISATRGQDGMNDGLDKAAVHAKEFHQLIGELKQVDPENAGRYQAMVPVFDAYYQTGQKMAQTYIDGGPEAGNKMMSQFDGAAEKITRLVDTFVTEARERAAQMGQQQASYLDRGRQLLFAGILLIQIGLGGVYLMMAKALKRMPEVVAEFNHIADGDLTRTHQVSQANDEVGQLSNGFDAMRAKLKEVIGLVSRSSEEVGAAAQQMTQRTEQTLQAIDAQRNDINMVASAMTEMSASAHDVARHAEQADISARSADTASKTGVEVVTAAVETIEELVGSVVRAADVIQQLERDSESIDGIVEVIKSVAEQTNLLALNAAIEAARAGEQGRGFAVVADEVRNLASRTQQSTEEIQTMVEKLQKGALSAVQVMEQGRAMTETSIEQANRARESLQTITSAVESITEMTAQIAAASEQQSQVAGDMAKHINQISTASDANADGARETASAGSQMVELAQRMHAVVARFKV